MAQCTLDISHTVTVLRHCPTSNTVRKQLKAGGGRGGWAEGWSFLLPSLLPSLRRHTRHYGLHLFWSSAALILTHCNSVTHIILRLWQGCRQPFTGENTHQFNQIKEWKYSSFKSLVTSCVGVGDFNNKYNLLISLTLNSLRVQWRLIVRTGF